MSSVHFMPETKHHGNGAVRRVAASEFKVGLGR